MTFGSFQCLEINGVNYTHTHTYTNICDICTKLYVCEL